MRFGMIRCSRSISDTASSTAKNSAIMLAIQGSSNATDAPTNRAAVMTSVSGYRTEIRAPQFRHRPRRAIHENTGTLSRAAMTVPHEGHIDRPPTMERRAGTRWVTTVRKDPINTPMRPNTTWRRVDMAAARLRPELGPELLPELPLQRATEADDAFDPLVVDDVEAVLHVHAARVQGALGGVRLVLERHLAGRVQKHRDTVVRIGRVAVVHDDRVLAVDAAVAAVRRAGRAGGRNVEGDDDDEGARRPRDGRGVAEIDGGVRDDGQVPAEREPVEVDPRILGGLGLPDAVRPRHPAPGYGIEAGDGRGGGGGRTTRPAGRAGRGVDVVGGVEGEPRERLGDRRGRLRVWVRGARRGRGGSPGGARARA